MFAVSQDQRAEHLGGDGGIFLGGAAGSRFPCLGRVLLPATWSLGGGRVRGREGEEAKSTIVVSTQNLSRQ